MMHALRHKNLVLFVRVLLGLNYFFGGLNYFIHLYALPPATPAADAFYGALINTGYLFALVKVLEIIAGVLLVINYFIPLTLVVMAPISINIFLFNTVLWPGGAGIGIFIMVLHSYLLLAYKKYYTAFLIAKPALV